MKDTTTIDGSDLEYLLGLLGASGTRRGDGIRSLQVWCAADGSEFKIKVNSGMWSPPLGRRYED
jgi:hypothetical protein